MSRLSSIRRLFQYRLRTLLLGIACIAGLLGWYVPPAHRQQEAVAAIRAAGGSVEYEPENGLGRRLPQWLKAGLGDDLFRSISGVRFDGSAAIVEQRRYESISAEQLSRALARLGDLPGLRRIDLGLMLPLADDDLRHIARLHDLKHLTIYAPQLTNQGLVHLTGLHHLENLYLDYSAVTEDGIDLLREALPNCRIEW